jgi:hypothetical protein
MKEVVFQKDLPYLGINVAPGTFAQTIGPALANTPMSGHWEKLGTDLFVCKEIIDIAGLTKMELTFFPTSGDVQRSVVSMGPTDGYADEWILVTRSPFDVDGTHITAANMTLALPGQLSNGDAFENFIWGQGWTWTRNTSLLQNFAIAVNTTLLGSGEPTNGDKLYVYRIIRLNAPVNPGLAEFGSARLLIAGQLREEAEFQQLMRMRRTYELQQSYDED